MTDTTKPVLELKGIGKQYTIQKRGLFAKDILKFLMGKPLVNVDFWALKDINLTVRAGESVGIIGENGSGKSTLLKILSRVTDPTEGTYWIEGRLSSLLELGAGFHPYLTGRENVFLNGAILGMSRRYIHSVFDKIVEFSGLEKFIDTPVQNYSSGMYIRLGFSIAVHLDPDILVVDEVLSVGDEEFQRKSKAKILEFKDKGKTILFVSHDLSTVRDICDRICWLKEGRIHAMGDKETVTSRYLAYVGARMGFRTLSRGPLSLIFERGKLILFRRGIELTKNCCGFTENYAHGIAHGSMQAEWKIVDHSDTFIEAEGTWNVLPVRQRWRIELISENRLEWHIRTEISADVLLNYTSVNLMLSNRYEKWITETEEGDFPPDFHAEFGQRIVGVGQKEGRVGAKGIKTGSIILPSVYLGLQTNDGDYAGQVTNTDRNLMSRTLQFTRVVKDHLFKKDTAFDFHGFIDFDEAVYDER